MKLDSTPLRSALDLLKPIVKGRTIPILNCVRLEAKRNRLTITASDIDQFQVAKVECEDDLDALCVNAQHLSCCIPAEGVVQFKSDGKQLEIKHGKSVFKLNIQDSAEFPAMPDTKDCKLQGIVCADLAEGIKAVAWAASQNHLDRPILTAIRVAPKAKMLMVGATDSHELACFDRPLICPVFEMLMPGEFADRASDCLLQKGAELKLSDRAIYITHDSGSYWCKQMEGKYPSTDFVRAFKTSELGAIDVRMTLQALDSCLSLSDPSKTPTALLTFSKNGLDIDFSALGAASFTIPGVFKAHECQVNANAFRRSLRAIPEDKCKILCGLEDATKFLSFRCGDLYVVSICYAPTIAAVKK